MNVTAYYRIGSMSVPSAWIAVIGACLITYIIIRRFYGKQIAGAVLDPFFTVLAVWKLSVVLLDFPIVAQSPMAVLYFDGGLPGFWLGLAVAAFLLFNKIRKGRTIPGEIGALLCGILLAQSFYQMLMALLNEGPLFPRILTLLLFAVFLALAAKRQLGTGRQLGLLFIALHLFVSSFQPQGFMNGALSVSLLAVLLWIWLELEGTRKSHETSEG